MILINELIKLFGNVEAKKHIEDIIDSCEKRIDSENTENKSIWISVNNFWKDILNDFNQKSEK